ncbi:MAG: arylsulfatase, partial [Bryobacterales bacterium]|nr:arylsulfatase [Bryobacterales bacterium]
QPHVNRRGFLSSLAAVPLAAQLPARPNIVLIVADDLGYGDLGCYGQKMFATPNIDRIASEGTRFTQAYAGAAVCAPSRCCLMTGKHTGHGRIRNNRGLRGRVPLESQDVTVAEVLKGSGYRTGLIGKWGLGEAGTPGIPNDQGFDEFFGFLNQDHALDYYPRHLWNNRTEFFPPGNQGAKRKEYVQDLFTDRAIRFLRGNTNSPFFLYLAYTIPHADSETGRDTGDGFIVPDYEPYTNRDWPRPERGFAAMMHRLDRDVGRIIAQLDQLGLSSNTLLIFTSDNGPALDSGHSPRFFNSNGGLRGQKGSFYEGGIRVPFLARWPGQIPAGRTAADVVCFWDFLPTAAQLGGGAAPGGLDGNSMLPALTNRGAIGRKPLYWEVTGRTGLTQAVRMEKWKAVRATPASPCELYDLDADPAEQHDLASAHPSVVRTMERLMSQSRIESPDYPSGLPPARI